MADFPYFQNTGNLKKLFAHIQGAGVPSKVSLQYLTSIGFKSKNDRPMVSILKTLGFLDSSGTPTDLWKGYRNKDNSRALIAQAVRQAYSGLFNTYPDADRRDSEALRNFFSSHTTVGGTALTQMVRTFQSLCELGDFAAETPMEEVGEIVAPGANTGTTTILSREIGSRGLTLNLNIQLVIPSTDNSDIYDKFFEALKKHLLT